VIDITYFIRQLVLVEEIFFIIGLNGNGHVRLVIIEVELVHGVIACVID
jgi:hypothetical protein